MDEKDRNLLILTSNYQNTSKVIGCDNVNLFVSSKNRTPSNEPLSLHSDSNKLPQTFPDRLLETGNALPAETHVCKWQGGLMMMKFYLRR